MMNSPGLQDADETLLFDQSLGEDATQVLDVQRTPSATFYRGSMQAVAQPALPPRTEAPRAEPPSDGTRSSELRAERDRLRSVNALLEQTIEHFQTAQSQIEVRCSQTASSY
jgi:hypothetical protein